MNILNYNQVTKEKTMPVKRLVWTMVWLQWLNVAILLH